MLFGRVVAKFGVHFELMFDPKIDEKRSKINDKSVLKIDQKRKPNWDPFFPDFGTVLGPKIIQKWIKNRNQEALKSDTKKNRQKRARRQTGPLRQGYDPGWARPSGTPISNDYFILFL